MDIAIVGRHTKVSDDFRERILDKSQKVAALAPRATRLDVHVVHERNPRLSQERERVELTVHGVGPVIRVEASASDRLEALDAAVFRLLERLRRQHERRAHRHQGKVGIGEAAAELVPQADSPAGDGRREQPEEAVANAEAWEGAPEGVVREVPLAGTPIMIRSKVHEGQPMTVTEAIDRMELVGHDFFLFHDEESGLPSAVYRRRGWTYGVIHLSPAAPVPVSLEGERARESA